ncbi:MAG TPA: hypothetical protein VE572_03720, partial [Nitrososphaeraceae archaeon]|nr:hypothetical protein [Nitrososphaeraceae archaeon]
LLNCLEASPQICIHLHIEKGLSQDPTVNKFPLPSNLTLYSSTFGFTFEKRFVLLAYLCSQN